MKIPLFVEPIKQFIQARVKIPIFVEPIEQFIQERVKIPIFVEPIEQFVQERVKIPIFVEPTVGVALCGHPMGRTFSMMFEFYSVDQHVARRFERCKGFTFFYARFRI